MLLSKINSDFGQRPLSQPYFGEETVSSPMQRYPVYNYAGEPSEQKMVHHSTGVSPSLFQMRPEISYAQVDPLVSPTLGVAPSPGAGQDPTRMAMHIQQLMCKVCGDTASGNHFGVLSCEACKSFFRRSVRSGTQYACRGSRDCNIQRTTRNRCQYCRLQKCMAVGMRKEAVQEERKPITGREEPLTPTKANASSTTLHSPPASTSQHSPTLASRHRCHSSLPNIPYNAGQSGEEMDQASSRKEQDFDSGLTLESLLQAEREIVEPPPSEQVGGVTVSTNEVFHAAKESLIRIIEWAKRVQVFAALPIADRVKLLKSTWAEVMMLRLSVRTAHAVHSGKAGIVLATGRTITPDDTDDPQLTYVFTRVREELAEWFVAHNVDSTEITLLQAVILFNPDSRGISAAGKEKIHELQRQVLHLMEEHIASKLPVDKLRFPLLLLRLTTIKAISIDVVQHMEMHRTLGDTHLDRVLIELLDS